MPLRFLCSLACFVREHTLHPPPATVGLRPRESNIFVRELRVMVVSLAPLTWLASMFGQALELVQDSKATIFLVLELARGGELFDRIKVR